MNLIAAFLSQAKAPEPLSQEEGECQIPSHSCGTGYTDKCLDNCLGVCASAELSQDEVLDFPHMICDKQSGQWIDAQQAYPEDWTLVSFTGDSDFNCVYDLY